MINFMLLVSRQGKTRLTKWYESYSTKEKARIVREVTVRERPGAAAARTARGPPLFLGDGAFARAQNVQFHRMEGRQEDRLQALRLPLLHLLRRLDGQ